MEAERNYLNQISSNTLFSVQSDVNGVKAAADNEHKKALELLRFMVRGRRAWQEINAWGI